MTPAVIELRQYILHPGRRDDLIALFEREFVESQEDLGALLIGQFRDLDDPNRYVWLRGFTDMETRLRMLQDFYFGPVWAAHREAANATLVDSDDVLLLAPAAPGSGFPDAGRDVTSSDADVILAGIHVLSSPRDQSPDAFDRDVRSALAAAGLHPLAVLVTEPAENTFPRLPVRLDGPFAVWVASVPDLGSADAALRTLDFASLLSPALQILRLAPTPRSRLRRGTEASGGFHP